MCDLQWPGDQQQPRLLSHWTLFWQQEWWLWRNLVLFSWGSCLEATCVDRWTGWQNEGCYTTATRALSVKCCAAWLCFPGRISLEMPSVPASSQRAEGFFFQEQLAPGKVDVDAPLVGVGHLRAPHCLASWRVAAHARGLVEFHPRCLRWGHQKKPRAARRIRCQRSADRGRNRRELLFPSEIPQREIPQRTLGVLGRRTRERPMYAASGGRPNCPDLAAHHPAVVPPGHPHHLWRLGILPKHPQLNGGVFLHDVVVHQVNFVDPNNPEIHTQNIENLWMRAKCKLRRQFGTTRALFATYLEEFMWQQRNKDHRRRLAGLLVCIRQQYQWRQHKETKRLFSEPTIFSQMSCLLLRYRELYVHLLDLKRH